MAAGESAAGSHALSEPVAAPGGTWGLGGGGPLVGSAPRSAPRVVAVQVSELVRISAVGLFFSGRPPLYDSGDEGSRLACSAYTLYTIH